MLPFLKNQISRGPWIWLYIPDILHTGQIHQHTVKAQAKTTVFASSETTKI